MKTDNQPQADLAQETEQILADLDAQRQSLDDPPGWQQICMERRRQITHEGRDSEGDDAYEALELSRAASCYLDPYTHRFGWPFGESRDAERNLCKFVLKHSYERRLVIAGALIAAELDRLRRQRLAAQRVTLSEPQAAGDKPQAAEQAGATSDESGRLTIAWERKGHGLVLSSQEMTLRDAKAAANFLERRDSVQRELTKTHEALARMTAKANELVAGFKQRRNDEAGEAEQVTLGILAVDQAEWSQATFGADDKRGPIGALKHLEKEAREAQQNPLDPAEYADCLLLILDAARRAGFNHQRLLREAFEKMRINRSRKWPKPTSDEPVEHIRNTPGENASRGCDGNAGATVSLECDTAPTKVQAKLKGLVINAEFEPGSGSAFLESLGELIGAVFSSAATSTPDEPSETGTP